MGSGPLRDASPTGKVKEERQTNLALGTFPALNIRIVVLPLSNRFILTSLGHGVQGLVRFPSSHWPLKSSEPNELLLSQTSRNRHVLSVSSPHSRLSVCVCVSCVCSVHPLLPFWVHLCKLLSVFLEEGGRGSIMVMVMVMMVTLRGAVPCSPILQACFSLCDPLCEPRPLCWWKS